MHHQADQSRSPGAERHTDDPLLSRGAQKRNCRAVALRDSRAAALIRLARPATLHESAPPIVDSAFVGDTRVTVAAPDIALLDLSADPGQRVAVVDQEHHVLGLSTARPVAKSRTLMSSSPQSIHGCVGPVAIAAHVLEIVDGRSLAVEFAQEKGLAARDATLHAVEVRLSMNKPL